MSACWCRVEGAPKAGRLFGFYGPHGSVESCVWVCICFSMSLFLLVLFCIFASILGFSFGFIFLVFFCFLVFSFGFFC